MCLRNLAVLWGYTMLAGCLHKVFQGAAVQTFCSDEGAREF